VLGTLVMPVINEGDQAHADMIVRLLGSIRAEVRPTLRGLELARPNRVNTKHHTLAD
jgi:hypothetical protein